MFAKFGEGKREKACEYEDDEYDGGEPGKIDDCFDRLHEMQLHLSELSSDF